MPPFRLLDRLRTTYAIRRQTIIGPLIDALRLRAVLRRVERRARGARVLGPEEFGPYLRLLTVLSPQGHLPVDLAFDHVIVRQEALSALDRRLLDTLHQTYQCTYANPRYALFGRPGPAAEPSALTADVAARITTLVQTPAFTPGRIDRIRDVERVILVTTFNRPEPLRRTLTQLAALGHAMLVVDDGSSEHIADANRAICLASDARYVRLPDNRGLSAALNIGLSYLLADPQTRWISYFQDDVDVDPSIMGRLRILEHADERPLITGYDADEHPTVREEDVAGVRVKLKRTSPAVHLHAHAKYWAGVLPIPTQYLGAPRRRWNPSLEDYWIVNDAPASVGRRGLLMPCLPGLVRTFLWHEADSTWGNPNLPDPPLAAAAPDPGRPPER